MPRTRLRTRAPFNRRRRPNVDHREFVGGMSGLIDILQVPATGGAETNAPGHPAAVTAAAEGAQSASCGTATAAPNKAHCHARATPGTQRATVRARVPAESARLTWPGLRSGNTAAMKVKL